MSGEARGATTIQGEALGTPAYMAPEQRAGGAVDRRTDVYGLGVTLYHLLAGAAPRSEQRLDALFAAKAER